LTGNESDALRMPRMLRKNCGGRQCPHQMGRLRLVPHSRILYAPRWDRHLMQRIQVEFYLCRELRLLMGSPRRDKHQPASG
jgi:hypothetical protein